MNHSVSVRGKAYGAREKELFKPGSLLRRAVPGTAFREWEKYCKAGEAVKRVKVVSRGAR